VEIERCPGCGASVRVQAAWCSLCYFDLDAARKPMSQMASAGAPLVEAAIEPGPAQLSATAAFGDAIADAEIVDGAAGNGVGTVQSGVPAARSPQGESAGSARPSAGWPCGCGTLVALDQNDCHACGKPFLAELRVATEVQGIPGVLGPDNGRHRRGGRFARQLQASRKLRLTFGAFIALVVAVAVPGIIALFG